MEHYSVKKSNTKKTLCKIELLFFYTCFPLLALAFSFESEMIVS
jgi:hypothetical protein